MTFQPSTRGDRQSPVHPVRSECARVTASTQPVSIVSVWTRKVDVAIRFGRVNTALHIRDALHGAGKLTEGTLTNAFEGSGRINALYHVAMALVVELMSGRPLPLQSAIFAASAQRILEDVDWQSEDVVYLDGIRTLLLLRGLRKTGVTRRIVVDFDDLMSRRFQTVHKLGLPLSLGYMENLLSPSLVRFVSDRLTRLIVRYERTALRAAELEVLRLADAVVVVNNAEAEMLRSEAVRAGVGSKADIVTIPPPMDRQVQVQRRGCSLGKNVWRAVFVGSDIYVQNSMAIAYLLGLWSKYEIGTQLHIYGRSTKRWPSVSNVTFHGYVDDIAEAYRDLSFVVYHCQVPGGIKTKVLEAFGYGAPVIANSLAFEGILPPGYPTVIEDEIELVTFLKDPILRELDLHQAVDTAYAYVEKEHSSQVFSRRWREVVHGGGTPPVPPAPPV